MGGDSGPAVTEGKLEGSGANRWEARKSKRRKRSNETYQVPNGPTDEMTNRQLQHKAEKISGISEGRDGTTGAPGRIEKTVRVERCFIRRRHLSDARPGKEQRIMRMTITFYPHLREDMLYGEEEVTKTMGKREVKSPSRLDQSEYTDKAKPFGAEGAVITRKS